MPNLIINTVCNLKCPYCFAEDCKTQNANQNMTYHRFKQILNFVSQTHDYVGILGGEPTIHPEFDKFLCDIIASDKIQNTTVFTNGLEVDKHLGIFSSYKVGLLINFNDQTIVGGKNNLDRIMSNIEMLIDLKKEHIATGFSEEMVLNTVNLGLNLYKENQDFTDILTALKTFDMHGLRLSCVVPNTTDKKDIHSLDYFRQMKPTIMHLFEELARIEVVPHADCNYIPLCIFTDKEIQYLDRKFGVLCQKYNKDFNFLRHTFCENGPLDIYPDGTVARCFGFSEYDRQNIDNYQNLNDIMFYFKRTIENPSFLTCSNKECKDCYNHKVQLCSGGCLSYKTEQIKKIVSDLGEVNV